jgi:hypothetical protein
MTLRLLELAFLERVDYFVVGGSVINFQHSIK